MLINNQIPKILEETKQATLIAATKYVGVEEMKKLLSLGITHFGENIASSFLEKYEILKNEDITWHFIGHLQTNKVKKLIHKINFLHSLDRLSLAEAIQKERTTVLNCFVEVNISKETNKTGLPIEEVQNFIQIIKKYDKIRVVGLMGMAMNTDDEQIIRHQFHELRILKESIETMNLEYAPCHFLSMGMSGDYKIALLEQATHIRLGSILFRNEG